MPAERPRLQARGVVRARSHGQEWLYKLQLPRNTVIKARERRPGVLVLLQAADPSAAAAASASARSLLLSQQLPRTPDLAWIPVGFLAEGDQAVWVQRSKAVTVGGAGRWNT